MYRTKYRNCDLEPAGKFQFDVVVTQNGWLNLATVLSTMPVYYA